MAKRDAKVPVTSAVRAMRAAGVAFEPHLYRWESKGAKASSAALGVPLEEVVKTIVLLAEGGPFAKPTPVIALMDGEHEVSVRTLARHLGAKTVAPAPPAKAERLSGYQVGGTSPFGTRTPMAVHVPEHLPALDRFYVNGGKRGFLVRVTAAEALAALEAAVVEGLAVPPRRR